MVWMGKGGKEESWREPWEDMSAEDLECGGDAEPPKTTGHIVT